MYILTSRKYQVGYLSFIQIFKEYQFHENGIMRLTVTAKRAHKIAAF